MKWLALETSTEVISVAASDGERWAVREPLGGAQASFHLLPAVQAVLDELQLTLPDLDAIAFGQGPGAFTGLRTACAVAQGLALGADCPVLPMDSLSLVAEAVRQQVPQVTRVLALLDARMGQVYVGALQWQAELGHWEHVQALAVINPDALSWPPGWQADAQTRVAGLWLTPQAPEREQALQARLGDHAWMTIRPHARALLALAPGAWRRDLAVAPEAAAPVYVRNQVAQTTAEREAERRLKASSGGGA